MAYVAVGVDVRGRPLPLDDPLAGTLRAALDGAAGPAGIVEALLGVPEVFGPDLRDSPVLRALLVDQVAALLP